MFVKVGVTKTATRHSGYTQVTACHLPTHLCQNSRKTAKKIFVAASDQFSTGIVDSNTQQIIVDGSKKVDYLVDNYSGGHGGDGNVGGNGNGGGNGHGGSDDGGSMNPTLAVLLAAGKTLESLPNELAKGVAAGKVSEQVLLRYLAMENHILYKFFMPLEGFRQRLLADPGFMVKVGIECGIGIFTKSTAEYEKRKGTFSKELDFVFANVVMALIADFMLVWLPAPKLSLLKKPSQARFRLLRVFDGCPDNAFQTVAAGAVPYTVIQRGGAIVRNGIKLLGVGFFSSLLGVGITNALISLRQFADPSFQPLNPPQNILATSAAYASYMASSSNLRYQVLAGIIEERGIEKIFAAKPGVCHGISLVVRTLNTYLGSLLWVDYVRLLGMQKSSSKEDK